jgi:hypothetical protein
VLIRIEIITLTCVNQTPIRERASGRAQEEDTMDAKLEHTTKLRMAVDFILRNHEDLASDGLVTELEVFRDHLDLLWLADQGIELEGTEHRELVIIRFVPDLPNKEAEALRTLNDAGLIVRVSVNR